MTPTRIQRSRTKGWRMPDNTVAVSRPGIFGNPFAHQDSRIAAAMFAAWLRGGLRTSAMLECRKVLPGPLDERLRRVRAGIPTLRGKHLACWCPLHLPCHADVLLEIANA